MRTPLQFLGISLHSHTSTHPRCTSFYFSLDTECPPRNFLSHLGENSLLLGIRRESRDKIIRQERLLNWGSECKPSESEQSKKNRSPHIFLSRPCLPGQPKENRMRTVQAGCSSVLRAHRESLWPLQMPVSVLFSPFQEMLESCLSFKGFHSLLLCFQMTRLSGRAHARKGCKKSSKKEKRRRLHGGPAHRML